MKFDQDLITKRLNDLAASRVKQLHKQLQGPRAQYPNSSSAVGRAFGEIAYQDAASLIDRMLFAYIHYCRDTSTDPKIHSAIIRDAMNIYFQKVETLPGPSAGPLTATYLEPLKTDLEGNIEQIEIGRLHDEQVYVHRDPRWQKLKAWLTGIGLAGGWIGGLAQAVAVIRSLFK